jgi:hypothetical protein
MRVSWVLDLASHTSVNLRGLKFGEELINSECLLATGLHDGLDLSTPLLIVNFGTQTYSLHFGFSLIVELTRH